MERVPQFLKVVLIGCGACAFCVVGWWLWRHYIPQRHPVLSSPITFTQQLPILDAVSLTQLEEIISFTTIATSGSVVALALPAGQDELLAAYSGDNDLRRWNLSNGILAAEFDLGLVSDTGTSFNSNGTLLTTAASVWDITRGLALARCLPPCDYHNNEIVLYPKGSWTLGYYRGSHFLGIECVEKHCNSLTTYSVGDVEDPKGLLTIDKIALDTTGDFAAVAFEQRNIRIYGFTGEAVFDLIYRVELGERNGRGAATRALAFDDTRSWLAHLRGDQLSVWDLRWGRNRLQFSVNVPTGNVLTFDRMGKFLLVGTESVLQVWDVASKNLLKEYATSSISALIVSPDGRLVIWGDTQGVIHVWGSSNP